MHYGGGEGTANDLVCRLILHCRTKLVHEKHQELQGLQNLIQMLLSINAVLICKNIHGYSDSIPEIFHSTAFFIRTFNTLPLVDQLCLTKVDMNA